MNKGSYYTVNSTIYKTYGLTLRFIATYDKAMRSVFFHVKATGQSPKIKISAFLESYQ